MKQVQVSKDHYHSLTPQQTFERLESNPDGLTEQEAKSRLKEYGFNEIPEKRAQHPVVIFLRQFHSVLIYVLLAAAVIAFIFEKMIDVYVIVAVILINTSMGYIQERKAERSIQAIKKMIIPYAKVYRDGDLRQIPARELVPGDVIALEEGDRIPADSRLFHAKRLRTVEASLTGESLPVDKYTDVLPEKTTLAERKNMVWMGTFIASGQARAIVAETGLNTAIGELAQQIQKIPKMRGHFEQKTDQLAKQMGAIAAASTTVIFLIAFFIREFEFSEVFLFTIAALVSGIPEGLPAVLVIVLAIGAHRMARRNAIIRTLPATETLGIVTVILTDKTGTLTENTMNIDRIVFPDGTEISVSGSGWRPSGNFYHDGKAILPFEHHNLSKLLYISAVCNNSQLLKKVDGKETYEIIGDPTEAAFVVLAEKAGLKKEVMEQRRIDDLPFNPEVKYRASLAREDTVKEIYAIGAPEVVLNHSKHVFLDGKTHRITKEHQEEILHHIERLTKEARRVLAVAYKEVPDETHNITEDMVSNLIFVGIVGMFDPPRPEVKDAIAKAKQAGIRVIMTTGDHKSTGVAVAKEIGLIDEKVKGRHAQAYTEQELLELSEKELEDLIKHVSVFARLTPSMKLKIADILQKQGHVVAMTGDGVNDVPALRKADIGIAMGVIGTELARESSQIVLADDNFASIVNAVEEGRIVFVNTRQTSSLLVTSNFAEHTTIISTLLLGFPLPLLPTQILWLNLVTGGATATPLATEPGHSDTLHEPPRKKEENILSREIIPFVVLMTGIMAVATVIAFTTYMPDGLDKARTAAFAVMAFTQLFNALNMRSLRKSVFEIGLLTNKYLVIALIISIILQIIVIYTPLLQGVFQFVPLDLMELLWLALMSSSALWLGELYKFMRKKFTANKTA